MTTTDGTTPQDLPGQPALSTPDGEPTQEVRITKAEWDKVQAALGQISGIQSEKANAKLARQEISKLRDDVLPLLERAHTLGSQNKPLNDALNQIQTEQTDAEFRKAVFEIAQSMRGGTQPTGAGNAPGVDVAAVLAEYQLDPKDPYVAGKLAGQTFATKEQAELAAARILRDQVKNPTNAAQQSAPRDPPRVE